MHSASKKTNRAKSAKSRKTVIKKSGREGQLKVANATSRRKSARATLIAERRKHAEESRAERESIVSNMTAEWLVEYRKQNPLPDKFWERKEQPVAK